MISNSPAANIASPEPRTNIPQLNKAHVLFLFLGLLPGQNFVDPAEDEHCPPAIDFRSHDQSSVNPQARQAKQGRSLLMCG